MHLAPLIRDLAIILGVAGLISVLFKSIQQPVVLGYIIAGAIVGPHTPPFQLITDVPSIQTWAELGVIFLMFTLGLEFSFRKLARVGGSAITTAVIKVLFFLPIGFFLGKVLGWNSMDSLFLGSMLSISSTVIILKALEELKLKKHRFADLIFGVLIVEDLFAILLLVALSTIAANQTVSAISLLSAAFKLLLVVGGWFLVGYFIVPRFMRYVARLGSTELLTILSLGLCLALVVFADHFHYSTALGAFIMGSILAESPVHHRIESSMKSIRDLFGAIFFVSIGMLIEPVLIWEHRGVIALICSVTILGKILTTTAGAIVSGQSLRNSVQVGFGLAQIGEFSFIIASLGVATKAASPWIYPIGVAVSLVTTFLTPYLIRVSGEVATFLEKKLPHPLTETLNRYAVYAEATRKGAMTGKRGLSRPLLRWSLNGIAISVIFVLSAEWFIPILEERSIVSTPIAPLVAWLIAIALSAPSVWAMLTARPKISEGNAFIFPAILKILTIFWIAALSGEFFSWGYVLVSTASVLLVVFTLFYRRLENSYHWFENHFLSSFKMHIPFSHLAPWDVHLVKVELHPNAKLVMSKISEAALRVRCGVNIVAIQRGRTAIVPPMPEDVLLPRDSLILLGTDDQIELVRRELEAPFDLVEDPDLTLNYDVKRFLISGKSGFAGKTIRQSAIREKYRSIVVGIERDGVRNINPDSDFELRVGDQLWIAGERKRLDLLAVAVH